MRPVTFHQILAGSGTALLIFGCAILCPGRALSAEDDTANTGSSFDNVEILTPSLNAKLAILRVGSDRTDTDLLSVFVGLKNKTARRLEFQMQTLYKDKAGNQLNTGRASWVPMTLKPHEESEYRSASISEDAVDFIVHIRASKSNSAESK